ncbi:hypothetical protein F511_29130 [Dorcoceras hygrometricum]|uniref:Uncharacterized protein n=1 Tax=Dorcoceras hygrometricum TaxID=472368 RepID=A0A2Z7AWJ7_9LAMI|nr:hypothetical protein F511_29130 [Dorcoceras hygrometricum]
MTSANSVDGLATMTSAVTSSESAVGSRHSAKKRWSQQKATVQPEDVVVLEKKSVDGISRMLKRNQQVHSFKFVPVAVLQTTKEELVIRKDFRISAVASIQRSRWKESMAEIESCNCLNSREQDLYYSGK